MPAGPILESYIKFFQNIGCLYFLESFLNFQSPCEIGFLISLSYRGLLAIFYFKTTFCTIPIQTGWFDRYPYRWRSSVSKIIFY